MRKRKTRWFYAKTLLLTGSIFLMVVLGLGLAAALTTIGIVKERQMNSMQQMVDEMSMSMEDKRQDMQRIMMQIYENPELSDVTSTIFRTSSSEADFLSDPFFKQYTNRLFTNLLFKENDLQLLMFFNSSSNKLIYFDRKLNAWKSLPENPETYRYYQEIVRLGTVSGQKSMPALFATNHLDYFAMSVHCGLEEKERKSQYLLFAYDLTQFETILGSWPVNRRGETFVVNTLGEIVYDSTNRLYGTRFPFLEVLSDGRTLLQSDENKYYVTRSSVPGNEYLIINLLDTRVLSDLYKGPISTVVLTALLGLLAVVLIDIFALRQFRRRTEQLFHAMSSIGGNNLMYRMPLNHTNDEFDQISGKFNAMVESLNDNIKRLYLYQIREKTAELAQLQATINPHFLYNTLEAIRDYIMNGEKEIASDMITSLSFLFRSIVKMKTFVTIREEYELCTRVVDMYSLRFCDRVETEIHFAPEIMAFGIIKNLLQPLLENYFQHGIDLARDDNRLWLDGVRNGEFIDFTLRDNGRGMSGKRLLEVNQLFENPEAVVSDSYGLTNVNERIRIVFGPECGIKVESNPGVQTIFTLRIRALECADLDVLVKTPRSI